MRHRRCCDDPENLREVAYVNERGSRPRPRRSPALSPLPMEVALVCIVCGTTLAVADDRGELFADY